MRRAATASACHERLERLGVRVLSDAELLTILLSPTAGMNPTRDAARMNEVAAMQTPFLRELAARKGISDARLDEFRWLLEELRVSLFAQELRTPMPVSVKRLQKVWDSVQR